MARIIHAPKDECVFVKNATTGVATVLYNLNFQPGEAVVYFESVYGAVEKGIVSLQEHGPLQSRKVAFHYPISEDELERRFLDVVRRARDDGLAVRAAVFDSIVSNPGVRFPFERFVAICRKEGILSVIDGAHGIGQIRLNMEELQPDFFVSNCHKYALLFDDFCSNGWGWLTRRSFLFLDGCILLVVLPCSTSLAVTSI